MLKTGQLVKDEYLTLFEAVGALEVRDMPTRRSRTLRYRIPRGYIYIERVIPVTKNVTDWRTTRDLSATDDGRQNGQRIPCSGRNPRR